MPSSMAASTTVDVASESRRLPKLLQPSPTTDTSSDPIPLVSNAFLPGSRRLVCKPIDACSGRPRCSLNLVYERDLVQVWFEPLGYPGRLSHVLGRFLVAEHGLKRLARLPLRVVGNPRAIEAPVDTR